MNISGIGSYFSSYNYNSIKVNTNAVNPDKSQEVGSVQVKSQAPEVKAQVNRPEQNFNSEDFASQYKAGDKADLVGKDADVTSLDMEKKATGAQKSQLMQQYQLFMGETQAQGKNSEAMNASAVRATENFTF